MKSWGITLGEYMQRIWYGIRMKLFPTVPNTGSTKVCIITPRFPVMGGVLTVIEGITQVTKDTWQIEYLAQFGEPNPEGFIIHRFGTRRIGPWHFPIAWLYVLLGMVKLLSLMHRGAGYRLLLPQDGVFSAVMAGLVGKLTGIRVVCIDHSDISLFTPRNSSIYREERIATILTKDWPWLMRFMVKNLIALYWPSCLIAARIAARLVDHYLIPGVPGDSIEEGCNIIGIPIDRVTRFNSMIDVQRHLMPDEVTMLSLRKAKGLPADAIITVIACRLSPEKSIDIAIKCISRALTRLAANKCERVRVVIAGDGPLRESLEKDVRKRGLEQTCLFWGELPRDELITLLNISNIFLYTSVRGACLPMAILEAMASGCAVIATTEPLANAVLLADGRGIVVPPRNIAQTSEALLCLLRDVDLCCQMGEQARDYIRTHYSPEQFRQVLLRATGHTYEDELASNEILEMEELYVSSAVNKN